MTTAPKRRRDADKRPDEAGSGKRRRKGTRAEPAKQVGALVTRTRGKHRQVLMVTSRDTGRWVIPKGWPIEGISAAEAALQEAFEEAGVVGNASQDPVGAYRYDKVLPDEKLMPCIVDVFEVQLTGMLTQWPEKGQRRRKWHAAWEASFLVAEPELATLLRGLDARTDRAS